MKTNFEKLKEYEENETPIPSYDDFLDMKENIAYMNKRMNIFKKLLKDCQVLLFHNGFLFDKEPRNQAFNLINKIDSVLYNRQDLGAAIKLNNKNWKKVK